MSNKPKRRLDPLLRARIRRQARCQECAGKVEVDRTASKITRWHEAWCTEGQNLDSDAPTAVLVYEDGESAEHFAARLIAAARGGDAA